MVSRYKLFTAVAVVASYLVGNGVITPPWYFTFGYVGTFLGGFLLQFTIWAFYRVLLKHRLSPLRHLPGPKDNHFLMGQEKILIREPLGGPQRKWVKTIPNDGIIRFLGIFNTECLFITSPKALSEVLTTKSYDFVKPSWFAAVIGRILGIGVLLAEGDEHKFQRKNLMPAFAFRHVRSLFPIFWSKSVEVVFAIDDEIKNTAGARPSEAAIKAGVSRDVKLDSDQAIVSIDQWFNRATLDIIGVAGMGQDFNAIADPTGDLHQAYVTMSRPSRPPTILHILSLFVHNAIVSKLPFKHNKHVREVFKSKQVVRDTCQALITKKKERLANGLEADKDILSVALESGVFTNDQLTDQLMTFLAAGHDTTATAMIWAIYLLSLHPAIQTRLRAEVRAGLPSADSGASIAAADIERLPYLNAVCAEVLRHHAPVPQTLREANVDTTIQGVRVPKGTMLFLVPWATNRDPKLWGEDVDEFDPERWLRDASGGAGTNYAFLTFLHGPRSCIGEKFARGEFACLVAAFVGRFEFELADPTMADERTIQIMKGATSNPVNGLWMKTRKVEGW
ncbi:hypothetical protein V493_04130 [Pseudogymnoascus sp. VKM F-4281 (FW-2241)]|nr:hypothetical protein V493_04130 [Pseudogymnoascus sp. VKM F-4281 (FW-2241)]